MIEKYTLDYLIAIPIEGNRLNRVQRGHHFSLQFSLCLKRIWSKGRLRFFSLVFFLIINKRIDMMLMYKQKEKKNNFQGSTNEPKYCEHKRTLQVQEPV